MKRRGSGCRAIAEKQRRRAGSKRGIQIARIE
jgi:hypothetical protein